MYRFLATLSALVVLFTVNASAVSFREVPCADLPGAAGKSGAVAKIIAGPYLVDMGSNAVTVMWQTDIPTVGKIVVSNGETTAEYTTTKPSRLDSLRIKDLSPDSRYFYRLSVGSKSIASDAFRTFPVNPRPVSFAVYGDTRSNPDRHARVIKAMAAEKNLDFVLHTGDLVSDGRKLENWIPGYFTPTHSLIGRVPFYTVEGNHDGDSLYFQLMGQDRSKHWRSFDELGIHVILLDSMESFDVGSEQYKWLISDLEKHKNAKWKFIVLHSPVYTSGPHGAEDANGVPKEVGVRTARKLLPALAAKYGIQATFSGHDHAYERSDRDGVHYIVSGGGGAENYGDSNAKTNPYRKVFFSGLHYCIVTVDGGKATLVAKTPDGKVLDRTNL